MAKNLEEKKSSLGKTDAFAVSTHTRHNIKSNVLKKKRLVLLIYNIGRTRWFREKLHCTERGWMDSPWFLGTPTSIFREQKTNAPRLSIKRHMIHSLISNFLKLQACFSSYLPTLAQSKYHKRKIVLRKNYASGCSGPQRALSERRGYFLHNGGALLRVNDRRRCGTTQVGQNGNGSPSRGECVAQSLEIGSMRSLLRAVGRNSANFVQERAYFFESHEHCNFHRLVVNNCVVHNTACNEYNMRRNKKTISEFKNFQLSWYA